MHPSLDRVATLAVILCAVIVAAANLHAAFLEGGGSRAQQPSSASAPCLVSHEQWAELRANGVLQGDTAAPIRIVEFADLECPSCRKLHQAIEQARSSCGDSLSYVFVHYALAVHRFARQAALAAECASGLNRFEAFVDRVLAKQDSIGLKPWCRYATEAGITDTVSFGHCLEDIRSDRRIEAGRKLGDRLHVTYTPTVFINLWRLPIPPYWSLPSVIDDILAGRPPFVRHAKHDGPEVTR